MCLENPDPLSFSQRPDQRGFGTLFHNQSICEATRRQDEVYPLSMATGSNKFQANWWIPNRIQAPHAKVSLLFRSLLSQNGVIDAFFQDSFGRILVTTPSNQAADECLRRLIKAWYGGPRPTESTLRSQNRFLLIAQKSDCG